jgi:hypothetical protein
LGGTTRLADRRTLANLKLTTIFNQVKNCFNFPCLLLLSVAVNKHRLLAYYFHTGDCDNSAGFVNGRDAVRLDEIRSPAKGLRGLKENDFRSPFVSRASEVFSPRETSNPANSPGGLGPYNSGARP